ncbi:MAG: DUF2325 domain-containing protein [Pseudomonadota bacterium]|nr:DUF2325 domain-containing protein [Pseudomonadota bacterium]
MRQLKKKAASGVTFPFLLTEAPHADEILLACLHGAEAMSAHLLHGPLRYAVSGTQWLHSHSSHDSHNFLPSRIQILLEKKFGHILKRFFKTKGDAFFLKPAELTRTARLREAEGCISHVKSANKQQALLKRIDSLERKLADAESRIAHETGWVPLVKASTAALASDCSVSDRNACDEKQAGSCTRFNLAGRCILCVGGRAKLYPEYRRLVETSGGSLLIYRSGPKNDSENDSDHLSTLFARADMVVCPADCVNHNAYFAVKRHCIRSGKVCVWLDRSNLPTFRKGIESLAALIRAPEMGDKLVQSTNLRFA